MSKGHAMRGKHKAMGMRQHGMVLVGLLVTSAMPGYAERGGQGDRNGGYVFLIIFLAVIAIVILRPVGRRATEVLHKRYGTERVGGRAFKYHDLLSMPLTDLEQVLNQCLAVRNPTAASWAFEALVIRYGGRDAWRMAMQGLTERDEHFALESLQWLLPAKRVGESSPHNPDRCLAVVGTDFTWTNLIGQAYLQRAKKLVGVDKEKLRWNKTNALKFLRKAQGLATDPASLALIVPLYESALYLMYKEGAAARRNE